MTVQQSPDDYFRNGAGSILRAEKISRGRRKALGIGLAILRRRQRHPHFRRNIQMGRIQRTQRQLQGLPLTLGRPDADRLLSIARERERDLRASHHIDRGAQGVTMKQIDQGQPRGEHRIGLAGAQHE